MLRVALHERSGTGRAPCPGDCHLLVTGRHACFIAGGEISFPTILEYRAGQWRDVAPDLEGEVLEDLVLAPGGTEGWAVGDVMGSGNPVLHLLDGTWSRGDAPIPYLWRAAAEALNETWAITGSVYDNAAYYYSDTYAQPRVGQSLIRMRNATSSSTVRSAQNTSVAVVLPSGERCLAGTGTADRAGLRHRAPRPGSTARAGRLGRGDWGQDRALRSSGAPQRFYDVPPAHRFYAHIDSMAAHNIIYGYADNSLHPAADVTRGQLTKMVVAGIGWAPVTPADPDVRRRAGEPAVLWLGRTGGRAPHPERLQLRGPGRALPGHLLPPGQLDDARPAEQDPDAGATGAIDTS